MRRLLLVFGLTAVLALPFSTPSPASAGELGDCPDGYTGPIPITELQASGLSQGLARQASAQDVNHNGLVCYRIRGNFQSERSATFTDDIFSTCSCLRNESEAEADMRPEQPV